MIFNILTLLSTYLFAFVSAAAVADSGLEARDTVSASTILAEVKQITAEFEQLTTLVEQYKSAGVGPTVNFTSTLDTTLANVEKLASDITKFNTSSTPISGLVSAISALISASLSFSLQFALWVIAVGQKKFTQSLSLTIKTLSSTVSSLSSLSSGHQDYSPIDWSLNQASSFCQGLGNLWGVKL